MKHCRGSRFMVHNVLRTIAGHGFLPICLLENQQCFSSQITIIPVHRCWNGAINDFCIGYFFAPLTVVLNFIIFSTILTTKSLKKVPSTLLVSNLAISDFFVGVYSLLITSLRQAMSYQIFVGAMNQLCPFLGFLWCSCQFVAAVSALLLTTDRYIAITFFCETEGQVLTQSLLNQCHHIVDAFFTSSFSSIFGHWYLHLYNVLSSNTASQGDPALVRIQRKYRGNWSC